MNEDNVLDAICHARTRETVSCQHSSDPLSWVLSNSQATVAQNTAGYKPSRYGRMKWLKIDSLLVPVQRLMFWRKVFLVPTSSCRASTTSIVTPDSFEFGSVTLSLLLLSDRGAFSRSK